MHSFLVSQGLLTQTQNVNFNLRTFNSNFKVESNLKCRLIKNLEICSIWFKNGRDIFHSKFLTLIAEIWAIFNFRFKNIWVNKRHQHQVVPNIIFILWLQNYD